MKCKLLIFFTLVLFSIFIPYNSNRNTNTLTIKLPKERLSIEIPTYDYKCVDKNKKEFALSQSKPSRGSGTEEIIEYNDNIVYVTLEISAYCGCYECTEGYDNITASGIQAYEGIVALPSNIPFGTTLVTPFGTFICEDRGGYITYTNEGHMRADIFMSSHQDCILFGRQIVYGYLIYK